MTPIKPPLNPFDPSYIDGLPERVTSRIKLTEEGTSAFVTDETGLTIGWAHSYTDALRIMVKHKDEGVGRDITALVIDTMQEMEHKLLKSELKRDTGGIWRNTMWYDELKEELLKHVYKGDPVDVLIYCAFAMWHGWDIAPAESSYPVKVDPQPLLKQHHATSLSLSDVVVYLGGFIETLKVWGTEEEPEPNVGRDTLLGQVGKVVLELERLSRTPLQLHVIPEPPVRYIDMSDKI